MTSTNDGKDVKSNQISGPKGKTYYIELYKSLDARLSGDCNLQERTRHICDAWRRIHSLCQHSAPSTHPHLLSWLQRHTAKTVLQTEWHKSENKDELHKLLEEAIDDFICESRSSPASRDGLGPPWETQLVQRGEWFQRILPNPWGHPTLRVLLDSEAEPPSDSEVLEWLKDERCVMFVTRLRQLAADKRCVDLALLLVSAVMDRVRASDKLTPDTVDDAKDKSNLDNVEPTFANVLKAEAGFTVDVWELLTDVEFVLLHKRDKRSRCIELAKQTPLRDGYQLVERLQSRLETSPREKKLWKDAKDVATLIAQVIITRCMVVPACTGASRTALYCCTRSLVRLLPAARLPAAAAALAAPAATARHLHTLAAAVDAQSTADMKPFVCELYVRAITAGMNELERLKLKTEKPAEARLAEQTLAAWLTQLAALLAGSTRVRCECALTAFSLHPSAAMFERILAAPPLPPVDIQEPKKELAASEFGSWASDSRSQTNLVKTSETLNLKRTQHQTNVLSTAILTEGEALGLSPDLCQDITVLLSGPRLKTLSWDMDREVLLEKCRTYMEVTHGGTRTLTTELKYLNLNPKDFDHLPEEEDDDTDIYYGIEKGYEHLVEQYYGPEEIWQDADDPERTTSAHSSDIELIVTPQIRRKKKSKKNFIDSDEDLDPLSAVAEAKRTEKKKERPHSKERSKERGPAKAKTITPKDPLATDPLSINTAEIKNEGSKEKKKRGRKKNDKKIKPELTSNSLSSLIGMKISQIDDETASKVNPLSITDSDYDSQGKSSINSEGNDPCVLFDGLFSMDELKSPDRNSDSMGLMKNNELRLTNGAITVNSSMKKINNTGDQYSMHDTSNVMRYGLLSPSSDPNQKSLLEVENNEKLSTVTEDVKNSITRLIQFRRQKAINEQRSLALSPPITNSPSNIYNKDANVGIMANAITKPQIPLHTQISPKPVEVPNIPKVYINRKQSEQLAELKDGVKTLLNNQNYIHKPAILCNQKHNLNITAGSSKVNITNIVDNPRDGYVIKNKPPPKPQSRVNEIKSRQAQDASNSNRETASQKSFQDFLQELQKSINAGAGMDQSTPGNKVIKKEVRPTNRVTPLLTTSVKSGPKTSPQCAKQSVQQKKMENALNTFSRLSYMHKNNKTDLKLKHVEAVIEHQDHVIKSQQKLSNMDHIIQEQKHAKFKYLHTNDLIISRVNKTYVKSNESNQLTKKVEKPVASPATSLVDEHPVISNMLQRKETNTLKTPTKYEHQTKTNPMKYEAETKHVPVEKQRDSAPHASNRFSHLSEKDQNDLLLLLRQQRKQNATQPRFDKPSNYNIQTPQQHPQCSSTNGTQPHTYNSVPCHQPTSMAVGGPSTSLPVSNTKHARNTDLKMVRNTVDVKSKQDKPMNVSNMVSVNCTKNADPKPTKSRKAEIISENVGKIAKQIATTKPTEWESVMNALLSHKTPSRGPNALEMALNKDTIDKDYAENILRSHRIMTPNFTEDPVQPAVAKDLSKTPTSIPNANATTNTVGKAAAVRKYSKRTSKDSKAKMVTPRSKPPTDIPKQLNKTSELPPSNPNTMKPVPSVTSKKQQQLDNKKLNHTDSPKRSACSNSKKQFTSTLPVAEDPFISGIHNSDYDLLEELMDDDLRQEIGELSDDDTYSAPEPVHKGTQNFAISKDQALQHDKLTPVLSNHQQLQKVDNPVRAVDTTDYPQQTSSFVNVHTKLNSPEYRMPENVNVTNNVTVAPNCNVSYNMNAQVNQAEHSFVAAMPQQTTLKNVVLLSSDIVYQPCTIQAQIPLTNLASNTYVGFNTQPNLALYQPAPFAPPMASPVIIGNMPIPTPVSMENIQTTTVPETAEVINTNNQDQLNQHEITQNHTIETIPVDLNEAIKDITENNTSQSDVDGAASEKEIFHFSNCETDVQETLCVNEKTEMTMNKSQKLLYGEEEASVDQERLTRKRMAILNRNIYQRSDSKPIPLTHVPLKPKDRDQDEINTAEVHQSDNNLSVHKDLLSNSEAQNEEPEPNQGTKMESAPIVDMSENCKENKSDSSQTRLIVLRSSKRLSKVITSDVESSDITTVGRNLNTKTDDSVEELEEKSKGDPDIPDHTILVVRKRSHKDKKTLTSKAKRKNTNTLVNDGADETKKKSRANNQSSNLIDNKLVSTDSDPSLPRLPELDIEEQLMGSKIPKNGTPPESLDESRIRDKDSKALDNKGQCEDVRNNSTTDEQPQYTSNIKDSIPQEKQELSCKVAIKERTEVNADSEVAGVVENDESEIDLTKEILEINDSNTNETSSENINHINAPSKELAPKTSIIQQDVGAQKDVIAAKHVTMLDSKESSELNGLSNNNAEISKSKDDTNNVASIKNSHLNPIDSTLTEKGVNKNRSNTVVRKISDIQAIPQSYKDSIIIEDLPAAIAGNDPLKKCVRIKLPSGRVFKATVHGKMNVNFDTLFSDPAIKDILLSNLTDKKRYTLNIKQVATTTLNEKDTILETRVQEVKLHAAFGQSDKIETINLLSDDEDDEPCQYLNTERGKYKLNIDKDDFAKHQKRFDQKCVVKLKRDDLQYIGNKSKSILKQIDEVPKPSSSDVCVNISNQNSETPVELPSLVTSEPIIDRSENQIKLASVTESGKHDAEKSPIIEPDVIEIDDSSNESFELSSINAKKSDSTRDKIVELKDLLLKDLGIVDAGDDVTPMVKDISSTEHLSIGSNNISDEKLHDKPSQYENVGPVDDEASTDKSTLDTNTILNEKHIDEAAAVDEDASPLEEEVTSAAGANITSNGIVYPTEEAYSDPNITLIESNTTEDSPIKSELQLPNCYIALTKCDDLAEKYKLINANCYVKLIRCDQNCDINMGNDAEIDEGNDSTEEIIVGNISDSSFEAPPSRRGSFSILNYFAEIDVDLPGPELSGRCSSPVIEIYEAIAALGRSVIKPNQSSVIEEHNSCKSEWCMTKCELQFQYKQSISEVDMIVTTTADLDEVISSDSAGICNAPSLFTILWKFFTDNNHITDGMKPICPVQKNRSHGLKRKSSGLDTGVENKICKLNESGDVPKVIVPESTNNLTTVSKLGPFIENEITSTPEDETTQDYAEACNVTTSSNDNEMMTDAANETGSDQNNEQINQTTEVITSMDISPENFKIGKAQIDTLTAEEDIELLNKGCPLAASVDETKFDSTGMTADVTRYDNETDESNNEELIMEINDSMKDITTTDVDEKSPTLCDVEIGTTGMKVDTALLDNNESSSVELPVDTPLYKENEITTCTATKEFNGEESEQPIDDNTITLNTDGASSFIETPNIPDHDYTVNIDKINPTEATKDNSDELPRETTNIIPTAMDIREDYERSSDGSEKVLIDFPTDETYCDPDLFWSGIEFRSEIVNSEAHEKELMISCDKKERSHKDNGQIDSNVIDDMTLIKNNDDTSNEDELQHIMLSPNIDSGILLKGVEFEDPEIGTCYMFPLVTSISESSECDVNNVEDMTHTIVSIDDDMKDEELKINIPEITYAKKHTQPNMVFNALIEKKNRKGVKRKSDLNDIKIYEKKYRKGKGIDYPKTTVAAMNNTAYTKQFKCLFDYFSAIKFSYSLPFYKDCVNVHKVLCDWPIRSTTTAAEITDEIDEYLFRDVETTAEPTFPNPKEQSTFAEEIVAEYTEADYSFSDINETNFNMGFGEKSDRVIQNLGGEDDISNVSAATLSDVKQSQPVLLSESSVNTASHNNDEVEMLRRHSVYLQMRDKVRSFFRKTKTELSYDWAQENKKNVDTYDTSTFPFGLTDPVFIEPRPVEAIVQVVQVGQLPVSVAAQNPMTCDPRVTHVADISPSQCSAGNSPNSDSQSDIKTEYTELTTADFSLPLMHNYTHYQSMPMESQEASNMPMPDDNILIETEIKSVVKIELMEELPDDNQEINEDDENNYENNDSQNTNNVDYSFPSADTNADTTSDDTDKIDGEFEATEKEHNVTPEKTDQIAHAMNVAGITTTASTEPSNTLVNMLSQKFDHDDVNTAPSVANDYPKSNSVNAMSLQQALAQILPPPLNQISDNNQQTQNASVTPQVLHIVQGKNGSANHITLVDNTQQSVINAPNAPPLLHIVQNKSNPAAPTTNGTPAPPANTFSGLSLVDAGLQQGGNQLLHIVNTGNQKNTNGGQLLKRVNLLTNLGNAQGSNEQKMVQFVCKSADGKAIQLNGPHQRSMVLRLQPIETPSIPAAQTKPVESQDVDPTPNAANTVPAKGALTPQEIKSRSIYEDNYAKFIQSSSNKTTIIEKATTLPKFNQAFGKQVYQDGNQKANEIINGNSLLPPVNNNNDTSECQSTENGINLEHMSQMNNPPLLIRKSPTQTTQAQPNLAQPIKQTIAPVNLQTMHGGVIYTRQIPVNIGGGQTINLITVPSTELIDDSTQKQQTDVKFVNQGEMEPSIIKIVPQSAAPNTDADSSENNTHAGATTENSNTPQPQPVLTQMRIKLPMLSKAPQMVSGARVVRPSFFQIQRNVIGGNNQQVYQQLVLTAAPPLAQQTIRLPQTQASRQIKVPTDSQSSAESQMSSSTLEQLREFDLVLEQVKERSTVQPNGKPSNSTLPKLHTPSNDATDGTKSAAPSKPAQGTQQVLYSISNNQPLNVAYVNRKATVATPTKSTFARSPDSSGIVDSSTSSHIKTSHTVTRTTSSSDTPAPAQPKPTKPKPKPRPKAASNPPNTLKLPVPPKPSTQKPLEDELTTQRILYILAEYKEQVENSPDKDKPAPRRRTNPPLNPIVPSKRRKCSNSSRRPGVRDISPINCDDTCRTMGSEDSSCGECNESCIDSHSPQGSPRKVVRKLTFEHEIPAAQPKPQPPRNVIVADGQTITVARGTAGKPATAVLMPANYILPVSMVKNGQQIAIVTNRGPKLLTVGGGEGGTTNALLLQRLIGPAGLKPVLARPGVRHVRLPTAALHNLQAFNLAAAAAVQPDTTASPVSATTPPELVDTRANGSPWSDRRSDVKPERGSSPDDSEPWNLPSSTDPHDYIYEDTGRTDNMDRTVLVVHKRDGSSYRQHRLTHVSTAALRHKYAILEHELRLQKSLSEECEDLGVDSPSAAELFPEAELLFAASPAHEHTQDHAHHSHTPQPTFPNQSGIPQPDIDDQIATDQLLTRDHVRDDRADLNLGLEDVGIVTVSEDGMQATIALDQEEFARSHPNTTFHSEPTDDAEVHPFTISGLKGRHITSTIFHSNRPAGTVLMTAPQTTVISQATAEPTTHHVKYNIDNMINTLPGSHPNTIHLSTVLVKDDGLTRFDNLLNDTRELHLTNTASAIVHSAGNAAQVIRRVCYDNDKRDSRFLMDEPESFIAGDDAKMMGEDSSRDATLESMADVDGYRSSPDRHTELFWESNSASERSESRRPLDYSSDSEKCCKSPFDENNSTDSSGIGTHMRLDTVIKEARGIGPFGDDGHRPLRTYPAKRLYHSLEKDIARSVSGKTRAGERSPDGLEVRRRASARGVVKRGCHCCSGEPAPPRPKKPRQRKPTLDFTAQH